MRFHYTTYSKAEKKIVGAFGAGVLGVYIEPLYLSVYLLHKFIKGQIVKRRLLFFFIFLISHGLLMSLLTGYNTFKLFQQTLLLFIVLFGYTQLYYQTNKGLEFWFNIYLKFVYLLALLGLFQYGVFLLTGVNVFPYTLDMLKTSDSARLHSILMEPGSIASFFMPAICYIVISRTYFKTNKFKCITIFTAALCTFSSLLFVGLFLSLVYRFYEKLRKLRIVFLLLSIFVLYEFSKIDYENTTYDKSANNIENAYQKITESVTAISFLLSSDSDPYYFESFNASTYSTMTNCWIALNAPYRFTGTGLGSHQQNYESLYSSSFSLYGLNKEDGYSLFVRLLSEFGYIGIGFYIYFIIRCFNRRNILSVCFLIFIICLLIKGGHYTINCTALFQFLYYQCSKTTVNEAKISNPREWNG